MSGRRTRTAAAVVVLGVLAACCGGGGDDLTRRAEARLAPLVDQMRARAGSFDPDGAQLALAELRAQVAVLRERGGIGDDRAAEILAMAVEVERRLVLAPTTTTTTTTTTLPPPPPVEDARQEGKDEKGKGKSEGQGRGKEDEQGDDE
jgi:hypothetical protein